MLVEGMVLDRKAKTKASAGAVRFRRIMLAAVVLVAVMFASLCYINDYYEATKIAKEALKGSERVEVVETESCYHFIPTGEAPAGEGIIFYPGGKVEESAYAPLMLRLAENGFEVYLMRMPARLAVLKPGAAKSVIGGDVAALPETEQGAAEPVTGGDAQEAPKERRWILMGHSLGGAMAALYAAGHSDEISTLVLLAAYSTADLSDSNISVLCLYGSEDGVMNRDKYEKNRANLPADACERVIDGGNHAGFAFYGEQDGDHPAAISRDEQQEVVVDALLAVLSSEER